jgi:hypothetical protein
VFDKRVVSGRVHTGAENSNPEGDISVCLVGTGSPCGDRRIRIVSTLYDT